jgi:prepilin-type N-terminal cleavage/methylation domain-containing protein
LESVVFRKGVFVPSRAGFTLLELLVTLAVLLAALLLVVPAIGPTLARVKIERATRQTSNLLARARMEAIKSANPVTVRLDATAGAFESFADVNGDGVFNPATGVPRNTTDYRLGRFPLPDRVEIAAPGSQPAIDGLTAQGGERVARFLPDGSIADSGAFRLAYDGGDFREIRIEPQVTPRTRIRYWDGSAWTLKKNASGALR